MKEFILLFAIIILTSCSSNIQRIEDNGKHEQKDKNNKSEEYAKQLFIDASLLDLEGKYAEAILDYQEALRLDPQSGIFYALAKDYLKLNKLLPALENSKQAVKLESENLEYLTLLGTIYSLSKNIDSAETVFNKIIQIDSTDINAYYNLAQLYEFNQPLKSLEFYKKVLEFTGPEWNILIKVAELNERLNQIDETIKTIKELVDINPSNLELQKLLIETYIKNKDFDKALELSNNNLEIFPTDLNLIELKGNTLIKQKNYFEGVKEYQKIIEDNKIPFATKLSIGTAFYVEALNDSLVLPYTEQILLQITKDTSDWQINAYLGEVYNKMGKDSLSIYFFKHAISLAENNADLWIRLGQLLFEKGNYSLASVEMQEGVKRFPQNFVINLILGLSLAQNSNHRGALPYLKKSVELDPNNLNANLAYSFSLHQEKMDDEALTFLNRTLRIDSKNIQALGMMGLIYDSKKLFNKSDSIYSIAVSIDSTDILILNNFAYSLAERGINLDKALSMVNISLEKDPENSSYLDTKGWIFFKLGEYDKAKEYIEKAIKLDAQNSTLFEHLGDIYFKLNEISKAHNYWNEALLIEPENKNIKQKIEEGIK